MGYNVFKNYMMLLFFLDVCLRIVEHTHAWEFKSHLIEKMITLTMGWNYRDTPFSNKPTFAPNWASQLPSW